MGEVIQQDCLEWMRTQPDNCLDVVVSSPPYNKKGLRGGRRTSTQLWNNANIDYGKYDDNLTEHEYQAWQKQILNEAHRILKPTGSLFYNHKIRNWNRKGHHPCEFILDTDLQFYQEIIWDRKNTLALDCRYLFAKTERIYWFCKDKPVVFKERMPTEYKSDVWQILPSSAKDHPASFPELLVELCLKLTAPENAIVYDPFGGSGTTAYVAKMMGLQYITTEIDPDYVKFIKERLQ
jgi:modification methylase